MSKLAITAIMLSAGICALVAPSSQAAILSPMSSEVRAVLSAVEADTEQPILARARAGARAGGAHVNRSHVNRNANVNRNRNVNRNTNVNRNVNRNVNVNRSVTGVGARGVAVVRPIRPWVARPYYGRIVAGVALGAVIVATTVAVVPVAPAPNLCWYWADPPMTQGYWDYCN